MDVNGVEEGKEGQVLLASPHGMFEAVIGENPVVHPLGGGALVINRLPFIGFARNRRTEAQIVGVSQIHGFAVGRGAADIGVRASRDASNDARGTEFSAELVSVKAPVDHLVAVGADRDAVP